MKKKELNFNEFKDLLRSIIKEETEKKDEKTPEETDTPVPAVVNPAVPDPNQPQPEMSDELKQFVADIAQIKKLLNSGAQKIRAMENDKKDSLSNEHKRALGKFYYDVDLVVTELDTFRNEYVEENIAPSNNMS